MKSKQTRKFKKIWTKKEIIKIAKKYTVRSEWRKNDPKCYAAATTRKMHQNRELNSHFQKKWLRKDGWTRKKIILATKKFKLRSEWRLDKSYDAAKRFKIVNDKEVSGHLSNIRLSRRKWTPDQIIKAAKKFKYKEEWRKKDYGTYQASIKQGIFSIASKHMSLMGSHYYRCLYSIEIKKEKKIYIGLTYNFNQRIKDHLKTKRFHKFNRKSLIIKKLSTYMHKEKAAKLEIKIIKKMKKMNYELLNIKIGGGLGGGTRKWNKSKVLKSSKKFKQVSRWKKTEPGAVNAAIKNGYYQEATKHMKRLWKPIWNKKKVFQEALKFKTRTEWARNSTSYDHAQRKGWLNQATKHMNNI